MRRHLSHALRPGAEVGTGTQLTMRGRIKVGTGLPFRRLPLVHADDEDTIRSGAGRAALEAATWAPASLLHGAEVTWRAESDDLIVASWDVPDFSPTVSP